MYEILPINNQKMFEGYIHLLKMTNARTDKFTTEYIKWLYDKNPNGSVIGYDAFYKDKLVAHYACIPIITINNNKKEKTLLSLNTATHPEHRKKGLFTKLALETYNKGKDLGYSSVIGVANSNSTHGFVSSLGFEFIKSLEFKIGFGSMNLNNENKKQDNIFRVFWDIKQFSWRIQNPSYVINVRKNKNITSVISSGLKNILIPYTEMPFNNFPQLKSSSIKFSNFKPRVFIGLLPPGLKTKNRYIKIPNFFKTIPLNFIYKRLDGGAPKIGNQEIYFSFLDFDIL